MIYTIISTSYTNTVNYITFHAQRVVLLNNFTNFKQKHTEPVSDS